MTTFARIFSPAVLLALLFTLSPAAIGAAPPPDMPLPPCATTPGVDACAILSPDVTGVSSGKLGEGATVTITTVPTHGVCFEHIGYAEPFTWSPSPCYSGVETPAVVGCAFFDLKDGATFKQLPCADALYRDRSRTPTPLLTMTGPKGGSCSAAGNFQVYIYGNMRDGDALVGWAEYGPQFLDCRVTFNGPRPDGLHGPTWVKLRVGISQSQTGDYRRGYSRTAHIYVPVDGDLRDAVDVDVVATATIQEADWDNGRVTALYRATLWNRGGETAENVALTVGLPSQLKYLSTSDALCVPADTMSDPASRGGTLQCSGFDMPAGSFRAFDVVARVVNATDLDGIQSGEIETMGVRGVAFKVVASNDTDTSNNEVVAELDIPFRNGSYSDTVAAMQALNTHFDYMTNIRASQCNVYKDDIFNRLEQLRTLNPDIFANLSYGGVTSGAYDIGNAGGLLGRSLGHVGVVVYAKGTNYRRSGVIINGTPMPSPLSGDSFVGPGEASGSGTAFSGATSIDGRYLRTAADKFPGIPKEESSSAGYVYGFEGKYGHNSVEFGGTVPQPPAVDSCPFAPDAVVVNTESPVEIILTNSRGQRVETSDGGIITQELDSGIHSMAFPHIDGTYGWTLALPVDDYDVQLRGTREGSYRLTLTTFGADGTPDNVVTSGVTSPGKIDAYAIGAPLTPSPVPPTPDPPRSGNERSGGGGGLDATTLLALGLALFARQFRFSPCRARRAARRTHRRA